MERCNATVCSKARAGGRLPAPGSHANSWAPCHQLVPRSIFGPLLTRRPAPGGSAPPIPDGRGQGACGHLAIREIPGQRRSAKGCRECSLVLGSTPGWSYRHSCRQLVYDDPAVTEPLGGDWDSTPIGLPSWGGSWRWILGYSDRRHGLKSESKGGNSAQTKETEGKASHAEPRSETWLLAEPQMNAQADLLRGFLGRS